MAAKKSLLILLLLALQVRIAIGCIFAGRKSAIFPAYDARGLMRVQSFDAVSKQARPQPFYDEVDGSFERLAAAAAAGKDAHVPAAANGKGGPAAPAGAGKSAPAAPAGAGKSAPAAAPAASAGAGKGAPVVAAAAPAVTGKGAEVRSLCMAPIRRHMHGRVGFRERQRRASAHQRTRNLRSRERPTSA